MAINSAEHIFAGTDEGVFCSTDHGTTWTVVNEGLKATTIRHLIFNSDDVIFAGTAENGISRSVVSTALRLPPTAVAKFADNIGTFSATLHGTVNPHGFDTTVKNISSS